MERYSIRSSTSDDSALFLNLAGLCPPLDVHTAYTYWVLNHVASESCFVALYEEEAVGFITSIVKGEKAFFWQMGVIATHRRVGLSKLLIEMAAKHASEAGANVIEFSISPANEASKRAFASFAKSIGSRLEKIGEVHLEDSEALEYLYKIAI